MNPLCPICQQRLLYRLLDYARFARWYTLSFPPAGTDEDELTPSGVRAEAARHEMLDRFEEIQRMQAPVVSEAEKILAEA